MGLPAKYPIEFRDAAMEMARTSGWPVAEVARELGINEGTLGTWLSRDRKLRARSRNPSCPSRNGRSWPGLRRENAQRGWKRRS